MPFLLDLYVFLGRQLNYCEDGNEHWDGRLGRYPQSAIDSQFEAIMRDVKESHDIELQMKSAANGDKGYRRTREKPSLESANKARDIDIATCGVHPIFGAEVAGQYKKLCS